MTDMKIAWLETSGVHSISSTMMSGQQPVTTRKHATIVTKGHYHPRRQTLPPNAKLKRLDVNARDLNTKIKQLIKASEEGRRQSTIYAKMTREATFHAFRMRKPLQGFGREAGIFSLEEAADSHWHVKQRHVSDDVDRKIVHHLRRRLSRRMERRLSKMLDGELDVQDSDDDVTTTKSRSRTGSMEEDSGDIFKKYTEYGDKVNRQRNPLFRASLPDIGESESGIASISSGSTTSARLPHVQNGHGLPDVTASNQPMVTQNGHVITDESVAMTTHSADTSYSTLSSASDCLAESSTNLDESSKHSPLGKSNSPVVNGHDPMTDVRPSKSPLPAIKPSGRRSPTKSGVKKKVSMNNMAEVIHDSGVHLHDINGQSLDEVDKEIQSILSRNDDGSATAGFHKLRVSPVPTPMAFRPETREAFIASGDEAIRRTLQGQVNVECHVSADVQRIFINSAFTDTEPERTGLVQFAYNKLKSSFLQRGVELQILDLHWGLRDMITDDQTGSHLCLDVLEQCMTEAAQLAFVSFFSQRYGDCHLPSAIAVTEYEGMLTYWEEEKRRQTAIVQQRLAALQEEEEEKAQQEDENNEARREPEIEHDKLRRESTRDTMITNTTADQEHASHENQDMDKASESSANSPKRKISVLSDMALLRSLKISESFDQDIGDPEQLRQWYRLDENSVPPMYKLQRISSQFSDFLRNDASKRQQARNNWRTTSQKLLKKMQKYAEKFIHDPEEKQKYFKSVAALEIERGIYQEMSPDVRCVWFKRRFTDLKFNLQDQKAGDYVDLQPLSADLDHASVKRLETMESQIMNMLPGINILHYPLQWSKGGISPTSNRSNLTYIEKVAEDFQSQIEKRLSNAFPSKPQHPHQLLYTETAQHVRFFQQRSKHFQGRKEILQMVKKYLRSEVKYPLVLHGSAGSGKTSLMAKAIKETRKWLKSDASVIARSIGVTGESRNIRLLLWNLCLQMQFINGEEAENIPTDYKGLMNVFCDQVSRVKEDQRVVIFLDAVDQLLDEHEARKLAWLPRELPVNVRMVLSTHPDDRYTCFKSLNSIYAENKDGFIKILPLPMDDAKAILDYWLDQHNHKLTKQQYRVIMDSVRECPDPLFLKVAMHEALHWTSYMPLEHVKLAKTVRKVVTVMFGRMEKEYGEPLVRRSLGYLTAAKNGITENEMEDLLSLDDAVMDDISSHGALPVRRIPVFYWMRVRSDLGDYLLERRDKTSALLTWTHGEFAEAAVERYLNQRDKAPSYHKALAEYFLGKWSSVPKPHTGNEHGSLRYVGAQPLYWEVSSGTGGGSDRIYNLRKLNELPYHFLRSQNMDQLKSECLCNFEFLLAKINGVSLNAVLENFHDAMSTEGEDAVLKLLAGALYLSAVALKKDPRQLASQIVGRMHDIITKDVPISHGDPRKYPALHPLFSQALKGSHPSLIPSITCLTPPGGILFDLLSGHTEPITAVTTTTDGLRAVTTSKDNTLKLWDLKTGRVTKTIHGVGENVLSVRLGANNTLAMTSETGLIRGWSLRSGQMVSCIDQYDDPAVITTAAEGQLLVAFFDGIYKMRTWDLEKGITLINETSIEEEGGIHKDRSILVSANAYGNQVLHAFRSASFATSRNAKSGKAIFTLKCHEASASVQALAVSREYFIVGVRYQYMKLHEIFHLEIFDVRNGVYIRSVRGCTQDTMQELYVNQIGSHALCICKSEANDTANIATWNIETEDHKHLAEHSRVSDFGACVDLRFCLTASKEDSTLRVWNLSTKINDSGMKLKKQEGIEAITPMQNNPRYVVAKSLNGGPISVWNVLKGKCSGKAVRIERGLHDTSDVVLVYDDLVIILADKGLSNVSEDARFVFTTVMMYNLRLKKFTRRVTGCYIVPAAAHEYVVLDEENLMGYSDNRSHFVIWSLVTGHVVNRIKSNFREMERRRVEQGFPSNTLEPVRRRNTTAKMTPWDRRTETRTARQRRHQAEDDSEKRRIEDLKKEKDNSIEHFIISEDHSTIVASYFAHHLCVFDVKKLTHVQTLENTNSMLFLHTAALTKNGSHLAHSNYDDEHKISYVTLWDCRSGFVKKRLKNERNVCAIAVSENARKVVFGKSNNELRVWCPGRASSVTKIKGYPGLDFSAESKICIIENGSKAAVFAGDISIWDLEKPSVLSVFSADNRIQCFTSALDGRLLVLGLRDNTSVVTLKLMSKTTQEIDKQGVDIFGEESSSSDDDEDDEGDDDDVINMYGGKQK